MNDTDLARRPLEGFVFDRAAANAHVMQPAHARGVTSATGREHELLAFELELPAGIALGFDTDGFTKAIDAALGPATAGYAGGAAWHMSVSEMLNVMGTFRRNGSIMPPAAAQAMLDNGFGIDISQSTPLGTFYNKNGLWTDGTRVEQSLAYFLPRDMELVVLANSPIGASGEFFRNVVSQTYVAHIGPEIGVGGWIARHGMTSAQYQQSFDDLVGNRGMTLMDVSGYGGAEALCAALWVKTAGGPAWEARFGLTAAQYQQELDTLGRAADEDEPATQPRRAAASQL